MRLAMLITILGGTYSLASNPVCDMAMELQKGYLRPLLSEVTELWRLAKAKDQTKSAPCDNARQVWSRPIERINSSQW